MLCVSKIDQERAKTSAETGQTWMKVGLILLEKPDRFGNNVIIQHRGTRGDEHIIIGNASYKGEIKYDFPHHKTVPSKLDSRVEKDDTFMEIFNDLP